MKKRSYKTIKALLSANQLREIPVEDLISGRTYSRRTRDNITFQLAEDEYWKVSIALSETVGFDDKPWKAWKERAIWWTRRVLGKETGADFNALFRFSVVLRDGKVAVTYRHIYDHCDELRAIRRNIQKYIIIEHMEKYDYREVMENDIRSYLEEETNERDYETVYDEMFVSDQVTGNGSGSYTFNTWKAEENLCHNLDLLKEACDEFGCDASDIVEKGAEWADVTIRCYLLSEVLSKVLPDYTDEEDDE